VRTPWLPPEKITTSSGRAYYGYVLEATAKWFTVLRSKNRKILYIPAKDVIRRSPCEPTAEAQGDRITQPIANAFYRPSPHLKVCADSKYLKHHRKRHTPAKEAQRHPRRPTRVPPSGGWLPPTPAVSTPTPVFTPTPTLFTPTPTLFTPTPAVSTSIRTGAPGGG
jgi:hypothetical protein